MPVRPLLWLCFCPHPPDPLPGGKGESKGYFMQGASPLASPGLNPGGTGFSCGMRVPAGGLLGWLPADLAVPESAGGGLPSLAPASLAFSFLSCPHPPDPLPRRGRGRFKVYFAGGFAPGTPAIGWEAALALFLGNGIFSFSGKVFHRGQGNSSGAGFSMPHRYKPDSKPTAEAAKPILQSPKSQPPSDTARKPQVRAPT